MNIFGFFAVIIICGTVIASLVLLVKNHITIKIVRAEEKKVVKLPQPEQPVAAKPEAKKQEELPIAEASMDAVIKAANELMGVQTETKKEDK